MLSTLHWLPINARIRFKIFFIMHEIAYGKTPYYLTSLVSLRAECERNLRSSKIIKNQIELRVKLKTFAFNHSR